MCRNCAQFSASILDSLGRKTSISILGFEIAAGTKTIDEIYEDVQSALGCLDKQIVVIVDDLDRLALSDIQDVLFAIKKGFSLPHISYVVLLL